MLFSAGVGIGMTFYGAAEPLAYYTGWYGTPFNVAANSAAAEELALGATLFNWGVGPWAIYALVGLGIGYFTMNSGLPVVPRSVLYPVFGRHTWGWPGHIVDMLAILATVFGLATSLGLGARQAASGLGFLFGVESGLLTQIAFIILIAVVTIASVVRGLDRGIRVLSNFTMALAVVLLGFTLLTSVPPPPFFLAMARRWGNMHGAYLPLSNFIGREDTTYFHGWTIFIGRGGSAGRLLSVCFWRVFRAVARCANSSLLRCWPAGDSDNLVFVLSARRRLSRPNRARARWPKALATCRWSCSNYLKTCRWANWPALLACFCLWFFRYLIQIAARWLSTVWLPAAKPTRR